MRKFAVLVLAVAVVVTFAVPAFAVCPCAKPCAPCAEKKPCPTCGQPCNIIQDAANAIEKIEAPSLPCPKPCNKCNK